MYVLGCCVRTCNKYWFMKMDLVFEKGIKSNMYVTRQFLAPSTVSDITKKRKETSFWFNSEKRL